MNELILIKHSLPEIRPELPPNQWTLSGEGRRRCKPLAEVLSGYSIDKVIASVEPKADETGRIISKLLNTPFECANDLHEHERTSDDFFDSIEAFEDAVANLFANPDVPVFGLETANQAHQRFSAAIHGLIERHKDTSIAVVTHGTVITLFVSRIAGIEPFAFWKRLETPSFVALSLPALELVSVTDTVIQNN